MVEYDSTKMIRGTFMKVIADCSWNQSTVGTAEHLGIKVFRQWHLGENVMSSRTNSLHLLPPVRLFASFRRHLINTHIYHITGTVCCSEARSLGLDFFEHTLTSCEGPFNNAGPWPRTKRDNNIHTNQSLVCSLRWGIGMTENWRREGYRANRYTL